MASNIKGPAIFLAQFAGDEEPFSSLESIARWAGELGYQGVQIPSWDARLFDLKRCAESQTYADEVRGICADGGVEITELSTHLQGQLVAVHPAYDQAFDAFAPPELHGRPRERQAWAVEQLKLAAQASQRLGLKAHVSFPGALAWPFVYPWPQRPEGTRRGGLLRARPPLATDSRYLRRSRLRRRVRDTPRRGCLRRRDLRDVPRRTRRPLPLQHQL
jgi:hypothetical protein